MELILISKTSTPSKIPLFRKGSLSRRATLTFLSNVLQQGARLLSGFVITPIVIQGLGAELYGAWLMIQQTAGYLALGDLRPMGTLKFSLAIRQHIEEITEKRRLIGAAVIVWSGTFPIIVLAGVVIVWISPVFIKTSSESVLAVRFALAIVILTLAFERLLSLPANVLRGMNLDFKAMGLNATTIIISGALSAIAILAGWGLPGVAVAGLIGVVLSSGVRFFVAKRFLPWFGFARPTRNELKNFIRLSGWLFVSSLSTLLLNSSELLILGIILDPQSVAIYATTGAVLRMMIGIIGQLLGSGGPGIAELCGRAEWNRLQIIRLELHTMAIGVMTVIGVGVLATNRHFLNLWVGDSFYGGNLTNLLLVLIAMGNLIFRVDSVIVDSVLEFRRKAIAMLFGSIITLVVGGYLSNIWGLAGMAFGVLLSRVGLVFYLPVLINRRGDINIRSHIQSVSRPMVVTFILFMGSYALGPRLELDTWLRFITIVAILSGSTALIMWQIGIGKFERALISKRFTSSLLTIRTHLGIRN